MFDAGSSGDRGQNEQLAQKRRCYNLKLVAFNSERQSVPRTMANTSIHISQMFLLFPDRYSWCYKYISRPNPKSLCNDTNLGAQYLR